MRSSDGAPVVPRAEPASYYGKPVIKAPVWTWEVPLYFVVGGMAGSAAPLALAARLTGNHELSRRAGLVALGGAAVSPVLLISDLGKASRFLHMLRVFKVTSPMSVGSWVLSAFGPSAMLGALPPTLAPRVSLGGQAAAAVLGPALATYTATLVANTAVPVWHEARRELPFVFAGSAMASGGGLVAALSPTGCAGPARRMALMGAGLELVAARRMQGRLGPLVGAPYHGPGPASRLSTASEICTVAGAAVCTLGRRSRPAAVAGGALLVAGAVCKRWSTFQAGRDSSRDPHATITPQRERAAARV